MGELTSIYSDSEYCMPIDQLAQTSSRKVDKSRNYDK